MSSDHTPDQPTPAGSATAKMVTISLEDAQYALDRIPSVEQYTDVFSWRTRPNPVYERIKAAIAAASEPGGGNSNG